MSPIKATEESGPLGLTWDYRVVPKTRGVWVYVVFWTFWAPATLFATAAMIYDVIEGQLCGAIFLACWNVFGWYGTLVIPYTLLSRQWVEWVEVSAKTFTFGYTGTWAARPWTYPLEKLREIALGWYHDGWEPAGVSLWVVREETGISWRIEFGLWLPDDLKREVFEKLRAFGQANGIPLKFTIIEGSDKSKEAGLSSVADGTSGDGLTRG